MRRSIKELSHFDWTRVKLLEDEYLDDQLRNVNIFSNHKSLSMESKLPALETGTGGGAHLTSQHDDVSDKLKSFSGPQVITIRLS